MIHLTRPYISFDDVRTEFEQIFASGMFTKGPYVGQFVQQLQQYVNVKHAYLATSATTALTMCLRLLDIQSGDEVIVSDFSFPASVNVIEDVGAIPVFADVSRETYNMLPEELERKITPATKAVIFVDALGNPSGVRTIKEICSAKGIPLIDDAACALGSSDGGHRSGSIADLTCFSFHPRKLLSTGEGGAITTNHAEYSEKLAVKLNHGAVFADGRMDFIDFGYNYRLPDLQCVMGMKQLEKLDDIVLRRNAQKETFKQALEPLGFVAQKVAPEVVHNIQSLVFLVPAGTDRNQLVQYLREKGVETTFGTYCLSHATYYRRKYNQVQTNALFLEQNTITLPCHDFVDVEYVVATIRSFLRV